MPESEQKKEQTNNAQIESSNQKPLNENIETKRFLINSDQEIFDSLRERMKTSLLINKSASLNFQSSNLDECEKIIDDKILNENETEEKDKDCSSAQETPVIIRSVKQMANMLVNSAMKQAVLDLNDKDPEISRIESKFNEKNYRYCFSGKQRGDRPLDVNDFVRCKSSSRMSYYKDFQTENDEDENEDENDNGEDACVLEFDEEPHE